MKGTLGVTAFSPPLAGTSGYTGITEAVAAAGLTVDILFACV